eukprot:12933349-Prorocentrum_lima.AAC.1
MGCPVIPPPPTYPPSVPAQEIPRSTVTGPPIAGSSAAGFPPSRVEWEAASDAQRVGTALEPTAE